MKPSDAATWLEERACAAAGLPGDAEGDEFGGVKTDLPIEHLHRSMLGGLLDGDDLEKTLELLFGLAMPSASAASRYFAAAGDAETPEEARRIAMGGVGSVHNAVVQAFALGMKVQEGR